jgi:hypothetical protein
MRASFIGRSSSVVMNSCRLAIESLCKWASSRLLELEVYTHIRVGALRSNRRIVVVTVLTRKSSLTALLVLYMAAVRGTVAPSIVGASVGDRTQFIMSCTRDHRLQRL